MATSPEALLISAVLQTGDHVTSASRGVRNEMFHAFPDEWEWIASYIERHHRAPSKTSFAQKFPEFRLKKVDDVAEFCDQVKNAHAGAILRESMSEALEHLRAGDVSRALKHMHSSTLSAENAFGGAGGDSDIIRDFDDIYSEVERRAERVKNFGQAGIPTGFPTLDSRTGGPQPGQFWVVAARLGQGKTWSLVRMAAAAAFSGFSIQYDALEQSRAEVAMRFFTFASSEYGQEVFRSLDQSMGTVTNLREYRDFLSSLRSNVNGKIHVADTSLGPISPMAIAAQIERNRPDALYLDYLTLMENNSDDWRGVAKLSASIKRTAQQYRIPIIAAAQLNRSAAGGKQPAGPEALAESDAIGRDADAVITMQQLSKRVIQMKLAKFRHGRDGFVWYCAFKPNTGHFEEVTFDEAQDIIGEDKDEEDEPQGGFVPRQKGSYAQVAAQRKGAGASVTSGDSAGQTPKRLTIKRRS